MSTQRSISAAGQASLVSGPSLACVLSANPLRASTSWPFRVRRKKNRGAARAAAALLRWFGPVESASLSQSSDDTFARARTAGFGFEYYVGRRKLLHADPCLESESAQDRNSEIAAAGRSRNPLRVESRDKSDIVSSCAARVSDSDPCNSSHFRPSAGHAMLCITERPAIDAFSDLLPGVFDRESRSRAKRDLQRACKPESKSAALVKLAEDLQTRVRALYCRFTTALDP